MFDSFLSLGSGTSVVSQTEEKRRGARVRVRMLV